MSVVLTHPLVADYLHRLETAAAVLPATRRGDLVAEIREHLTDALAGTEQGADGEAAVRAVLDRLGTPDEIVAAEGAGGGGEPPASAIQPAAPPSWRPNPPGPAPGRAVWGPVEVIAVVGLTLGNFVLPVVGPVIGLACVWVSSQWSRREKVVATLWGLAAPIVLALLAMAALLAFRVEAGSGATVEQAPQPVVSEAFAPQSSEAFVPQSSEVVAP